MVVTNSGPSYLVDGESVPGKGWMKFPTVEARLGYAGYLLAVHQPNTGRLNLRPAWPPIVRPDRECAWCRESWPCPSKAWALSVHRSAVELHRMAEGGRLRRLRPRWMRRRRAHADSALVAPPPTSREPMPAFGATPHWHGPTVVDWHAAADLTTPGQRRRGDGGER